MGLKTKQLKDDAYLNLDDNGLHLMQETSCMINDSTIIIINLSSQRVSSPCCAGVGGGGVV